MADTTNSKNENHTGEQTFLDNKFAILDNTDPSKRLMFQAEGLTTGTTRVVTFPDSDGTLALTSGGTSSPTTLVLPQSAAPAQTAEGSIVWDSDDDLLTVGDGSARKTMVDLGATQTISGAKTLSNAIITGGSVNATVIGGSTPAAATVTTLVVGTSANFAAVAVTRTSQKHFFQAPGRAKVGAGAGWVVAAAADTARVTCPAAQTAATLVVPLGPLKVGATIVSYHLVGQIESGGNHATVDANLFKLTAAAADLTDASIGAIAQLDVVADTIMSASNTAKTLVSPEVIGADESFYVLITVTTDAATDIDLQGVAVVLTEA